MGNSNINCVLFSIGFRNDIFGLFIYNLGSYFELYMIIIVVGNLEVRLEGYFMHLS